MSKKNLLILLVFIFWQQGYAQNPQFKFLGELHSDFAKLAWIPEHWPSNMTGVYIKRLNSDGSWISISTSEVEPYSSINKDLGNVESLPSEQNRLSEKLKNMIDEGRAKPVTPEQFKEKLTSVANPGASIAMIFAMDYDLMLINGFGLIDRKIDLKEITYGIFPVINGKIASEPASTLVLSQFKSPDIHMTGKAKVVGNNRQLRLNWEFDLADYRSQNIKGYDIIVEAGNTRRKLNNNTIWITSNKEPGVLTYLTAFPDDQITYYAVPISYFNSTGQAQTIDFNPIPYITKIPPPVLTGETTGSGARLSWKFDHVYDSLIKNIEVYSWDSDGYTSIAELPSTQREFTVNGGSSQTQRYRIALKTESGLHVNSNDQIIYFKQQAKIPPPENLQAEIILDSAINKVQLKWDYPDDIEGISFRIYTMGPDKELIYNSYLSRNVSSPMDIPVRSFMSNMETYAVQAMDHDRNKSELSNAVSIITPSMRLQTPRINAVENINGKPVLQWGYADSYLDLKGFQVFVNGKQVANENQLLAETRAWPITELSPGIHEVTIKAVSIYGLESDMTSSFKFRVE